MKTFIDAYQTEHSISHTYKNVLNVQLYNAKIVEISYIYCTQQDLNGILRISLLKSCKII